MNPKSLALPVLAAAALAVALVVPAPSIGQAATDDQTLNALLLEVTKQQAALADNQSKIDVKLAAVAENLRIARIYAGRGGGKTP